MCIALTARLVQAAGHRACTCYSCAEGQAQLTRVAERQQNPGHSSGCHSEYVPEYSSRFGLKCRHRRAGSLKCINNLSRMVLQ